MVPGTIPGFGITSMEYRLGLQGAYDPGKRQVDKQISYFKKSSFPCSYCGKF